jgi:hypothetical protein
VPLCGLESIDHDLGNCAAPLPPRCHRLVRICLGMRQGVCASETSSRFVAVRLCFSKGLRPDLHLLHAVQDTYSAQNPQRRIQIQLQGANQIRIQASL